MRSCRFPEVEGREEIQRNVFTPGETNCACTILLNLSTTLARLHSLMSFRSGSPRRGRNEVATRAKGEGRGRVEQAGGQAGKRTVPAWFLPEFA